MKKLVILFVAFTAISFASCGNSSQNSPIDTDSLPEVTDSMMESFQKADSAAIANDTTLIAQ